MINLLRVDDDTDHGGEVITGSSSMHVEGRNVAHKGDQAITNDKLRNTFAF
ncbi:hypothetical protein G3N59_15420 [Paraburkholderia sp. Ac-20340]|nr:hypothetical protein [Paraburkholderia sp. Ac-20340]